MWREFHRVHPLDDFARIYRPTAVVAYYSGNAGSFKKPPRLDDILESMTPTQEKSVDLRMIHQQMGPDE